MGLSNMAKRPPHLSGMATRRKSPVRGKTVQVRLQPDELKAVDRWAAQQPRKITRPEAIRRMISAAVQSVLNKK